MFTASLSPRDSTVVTNLIRSVTTVSERRCCLAKSLLGQRVWERLPDGGIVEDPALVGEVRSNSLHSMLGGVQGFHQIVQKCVS